jgi:capsular polysaccharide biosynthesis protein
MTETRRAETVDLDAEREVDLGSAWRRIAARWWLPVGGLVVGAVLGVLVSLGGGDVYQAKTLMYLGQPFTPGGGSQIVSLQTNPKAVSEIIRSEAAIARAAEASGLRPAQLRGNVTSSPIVQEGQIQNRTLSPLVEVVVQAPTRRQAEQAAASFAESVEDSIAGYVQNKMTLLEGDIAATRASIEQANTRIAAAQDQQRQLAGNTSLSLAERLLVQANINTTLQFYEQRSQVLRAEQTESEQLLSLAREVERTRVLQEGLGTRTDATSRRNAMVVGGLLGLLAGLLAAYLWEPFAARRKETAGA